MDMTRIVSEVNESCWCGIAPDIRYSAVRRSFSLDKVIEDTHNFVVYLISSNFDKANRRFHAERFIGVRLSHFGSTMSSDV